MTPTAKIVAKTVANVPHPEQPFSSDLSAGAFIAFAARVSNPSNQFSEWSYARLMQYLRKAGHWSPFEMSSCVMEITTTRDISHQILRHRSFSFQEFSQRYATVSQLHADFPARRQDLKNRQNSIDDMSDDDRLWWLDAQERVAQDAELVYREALGKGIAKEVARKVLPEGLTETRLYMAGTIRSWIHYLAQRLDSSTQLEHRQVAIACEVELVKHIPEVFRHVGPTTDN